MEETLRAFAALKAPVEWEDQIRAFQEQARARFRIRGIRWSKPTQVHLTVRFFGNIPASAVPKINEALIAAIEGMSPFTLDAIGLGCFPSPRRPRVLWAGLTGETASATRMHERLNQSTREIGQRPEERPFKPHLTLARIQEISRTEAGEFEEMLSTPFALSPTWRVSEILLMRSRLSPQGAQYETVLRQPLGG